MEPAGEALRREEERSRYVALALRDAIYDWDLRASSVQRNPAYQALYSPGEPVGTDPTWWEMHLHPDDRARVVDGLAAAFRERSAFWSSEYRFLRHDGTFAALLDRGYVLYDEAGRPARMVGALTDVSAHARAERRQAAQHAVARLLGESAGLDEAAPELLRVICEGFDWDVGELWTVDRAAGALRARQRYVAPALADTDFARRSAEMTFAPGIGLPGRVWQDNRPAWVEDVVTDANFPRAPWARVAGLHAAFGCPIAIGRQVLGMILFLRRETCPPDEGLRETLTAVGSQIGQFLDRKRAEERLRTSLREKEVLIREIHHRVRNNLQLISSLLNLQAHSVAERGAQEILMESQSRVRAMALIHEKLYQSDHPGRIDVREYVRSLAANLFRSLGEETSRIALALEVDDVDLEIDTAIPCGLLINELVSNAIRHGFPLGRSGRIEVALRARDDGSLLLRVRDDGVGLPGNVDPRGTRSLGLQLVQALTEQLNGTLRLAEGPGTTFEIVLWRLQYEERT